MLKKSLILGIVLTFCTGFLHAQTAIAPALGDGSEGNPYQISSLKNLYWIASPNDIVPLPTRSHRWAANYIQICDIDASATSTWDDNDDGNFEGWLPIGNDALVFSGSYNGLCHVIDNLYINRPNSSKVGFYGITTDATIKNLGLTNVNITGYHGTGALAGYNYPNSRIEFCYSTGSITGITSNSGGLLGVNSGSVVEYCYSLASVNGDNSSGGLVGSNTNSQINNSYSAGSITSNGVFVGGFVGANSSSTINNCYSIGHLNISNMSSGYIGGFAGESFDNATVNNCFWEIDASGMAISSGGTGKTTQEMKTESTYTNSGWDFNDIWQINSFENSGYPYLIWPIYYPPEVEIQSVTNITDKSVMVNFRIKSLGEPSNQTNFGVCWNKSQNPDIGDYKKELGHASNTGYFQTEIVDLSRNTNYYIKAYASNIAGIAYSNEIIFSTLPISATKPNLGDGSSTNPYQISSIENLFWIVENPDNWNKNYVQTTNIDIEDTENWYPDDMGGHKGWLPIGNIGTKFTGSYNGDYHEIDGLTIKRPNESYIGFFGFINGGNISNLIIKDAIIEGEDYLGGIAGKSSTYSLISNSSFYGTINGNNYLGGISGQIDFSSVQSCVNKSNIIGVGYLGGISGNNYNFSTIRNSYNVGSIQGTGRVGGLAGYNNSSSLITNCYSIGNVSGTYPVGGLVGQNDNSTVNYSYWNTETSGQLNSAAGEGKTTEVLKTSSFYISSGWDFQNIWAINDGINNGFPYLRWEFPDVQLVEPIISYTYSLSQNFPNPFNPTTTLQYGLPEATDVNLMIFDISGRKIKEWSICNQQPGWHEVTWDGTDQKGSIVSTGIYIYSLRAGNYVDTKKMVFMK